MFWSNKQNFVIDDRKKSWSCDEAFKVFLSKNFLSNFARSNKKQKITFIYQNLSFVSYKHSHNIKLGQYFKTLSHYQQIFLITNKI